MSAKRILTVGLGLASSDTQYASINAKVSLLDWDIVLFKPTLDSFYSIADDSYNGKRCLADDGSFRLKESCEHWRREIKEAVETGKTVVVYLPPLQEVYVATGTHAYSGTGRNRHTTRHVTVHTNHSAIPADIHPVNASGASIKLVAKGAEVLAPYWAECGPSSSYRVLLTAERLPACLVTRTGDKIVGALYRSKTSSGALLLLPDIEFYDDSFIKEKGEKRTWTPAASRFAAKLVSAIVALDKALHSQSEVTPEPAWAADARYVLGPEVRLRAELLEAEHEVARAQHAKEDIADRLSGAGQFRALLYENGKRLEQAIISALQLMGFNAAPFKQSDSEFDVVFESAEGRLIGEAEGKDAKAINIDKLRQLAMNIHEDLQREEVAAPAKPVLFGNAFRLRPVAERPDPFTDKCHSAAAISSTALVHTPDLFIVVQYLLANDDGEYARQCRKSLLGSVGRVVFPTLPGPAEERGALSVAEAIDK